MWRGLRAGFLYQFLSGFEKLVLKLVDIIINQGLVTTNHLIRQRQVAACEAARIFPPVHDPCN